MNAIFNIEEHLGVITRHSTGWNKELNVVSWNGNTPKIDIRDWSSDHSQMGRGITLTDEEMQKVIELMIERTTTCEFTEEEA